MSVCISCEQPTRKYKCPKCLGPYCSLDCYNQHKAAECEQKSGPGTHAAAATALSTAEPPEPTLHDPFSSDDKVPPELLEKLRVSTGMRHLLANPHLRSLLTEIDVAPSAWKAMRAAMQEPLFVEFADECLQVVEPMTEEEQQELMLC